ncbi:FecCD family ABC transporter permease [Devosia honganensis]|uniref:FecCD family ABC transporter permease n=1 Tax=Devosia honganensis TaxID=1610527 RepID=A0ABV7X315_9HYPH
MTASSPAIPSSSGRKLRVAGLLVLPCLLAVLMLLSVGIGTRSIPPSVTWDALFAFDPANSDHLLVHHLRLPRTLLAAIVGAALGLAGAIMQALTRNPLADPGILGVNAGASAAIVAAIAFLGIADVTAYMAFGLAGAALAGGAVYALGNLSRTANHVRIVLAGAALTIVLLSLTQIILINSEEQVFNQFRHWSVGSLQGRGYGVLGPVFVLVSMGSFAALFLTRALDTVALGNDLARTLGGSPALIWSTSAIVVVVLAGGATAAAGPIAFVGLTAPHVARLVTGPGHRWVLPYSMLLSAILMVAADTLGRIVAPPGEVGVGIMAALIGGPFFIALVRQRRISQL